MLLLCGKTATGKTKIKEKLVEDYQYVPIVTYTTRPMRPGEIEGIDYHFISRREFKVLKFLGFFAETTEYKVKSGEVWYYGTSKESLKIENGVLIVNPEGLVNIKNFLEKKNIKFFSVLIKAPINILYKRLENRGDNINEVRRRIESDNNDFKGISSKVNFSIVNDGTETIKNIAKQIDMQYANYMHHSLHIVESGETNE